MVNNKGYVFMPLILILFILISLAVVVFNHKLIDSVNQASHVQEVIDSIKYNYTKYVMNLTELSKLSIYQNISNSSLIADTSMLLYIKEKHYSRGVVNVSFPAFTINISVSYPLSDLLTAKEQFNSTIQSCLDANNCSFQCFNKGINGFSINYSSIIGLNVYDVVLFNDKMTLLYPYWLGNYNFSC